MIDPSHAKGLEFDAVVVAEPESIVKEQERGARLLYVALTRTTRHLTVVHIGEVIPSASESKSGPSESSPQQLQIGGPEALELDFPAVNTKQPVVAARPPRTSSSVIGQRPRVVDLLASNFAEEIRSSVAPELWEQVVSALAKELGKD